MFIENIKTIKSALMEYIGSGMYIALFFVALLYIFLKEENKNIKAFFTYNSLLILGITLNPIFNKLTGKIFTPYVYWRTFWMLPLGITIAYVAIKIISERKEKVEKVITIISIFLIIMMSGKFIYNKDNYVKVGNLYKIPDENVLVAQLIGADESKYKKALVPPELIAHIRQINANIDLAYKRVPFPVYDNHPVAKYLLNGDVAGIVEISEQKECNYVVINKQIMLNGRMEDYGFKILNETDSFIIYKK